MPTRLLLSGDALDWRDAKGDNVLDDTFFILLNGAHDAVTFTLPSVEWDAKWACRIDTSEDAMNDGVSLEAGAKATLLGYSVQVYKRTVPIRGSWRPTRSTKGAF